MAYKTQFTLIPLKMIVKKVFIIGIVLITLLSSCRKDDNDSTIYDIVLIAGQSNNFYGDNLENLKPIKESDRIKQLGRFGENNFEIIPAKEPLQHHGNQQYKGGYALTFSKLYEKKYLATNHTLLLIPCAKAGSSFIQNEWNKGDVLYNDAVFRTQYILSHYPKSSLKAILWHQGESDIENQNYQSDLDKFIKQFRDELKGKKVPIILGGMVPFWVEQNDIRKNIQNIIKSTPSRMKNTGFANPEIPFIIEKENKTIDSIHFNAAGLRELGKRYFSEFEKLID